MQNLLENIQNIKRVEYAITELFKNIKKTDVLEKAVNFAINAHKGQKRKSGEDYVIHPILVATIVARIAGDKSMVIAGLLHDVVEDTNFELQDIKKLFGDDVSNLVDGLTKIDTIREQELLPADKDERLIKSALSFRKMLTASIKDVRILIVKLCDRLHNLSTLNALPHKKQIRIAEESLVVYAPIAHRLGISSLKSLIEDFSFKYLMPEDYQKISNYIDKYEDSFRFKIHNFQEKIRQELIKNGFPDNEFKIIGRIKHKYSIYRKMQRKGINIDEVLDLLAVRIIVKKPIDIYRVLGIIHLNFKPLVFRFKDYVALQKDNGYQTLHTTVLDKNSIFEVQIRTFNMDKTAEYGLAAHWKYKSPFLKINTNWLEKLDDKDIKIGDYCDLIKSDLFTEDITVYSPTYEIFTLPRGSTALDFAYIVHSELGHKAKYAYIDKKKASLLTELESGSLIKIIAGDKNIPRCSWIDSVKTAYAKKEIKNLCNQRIKEIDTQVGYNILMTVLKLNRKRADFLLKEWKQIDFVHKIPTNETLLKNLINRYIEKITKKKLFKKLLLKRYKLKTYKFKSLLVSSNISISGVYFDYCCHPNYGDDIVGILKDHKVYIHHKMCSQVSQMLNSKIKMVFVDWDKSELKERYYLIVSIENNRGALANFLQYLAKLDIDLLSIRTEKDTITNNYISYFELEIETKEQSIDKIRKNLELKTKVIQITNIKDSYKK